MTNMMFVFSFSVFMPAHPQVHPRNSLASRQQTNIWSQNTFIRQDRIRRTGNHHARTLACRFGRARVRVPPPHLLTCLRVGRVCGVIVGYGVRARMRGCFNLIYLLLLVRGILFSLSLCRCREISFWTSWQLASFVCWLAFAPWLILGQAWAALGPWVTRTGHGHRHTCMTWAS